MNEFELIGKMRERLAPRGDRVVVWSGDDAAAVRPGGAISVTSTDSFVEGVHFRLVTTSLRDLGHKCLAASLSDLAAMGATAGEAYVVLGLPHHLGEREVLELADGAEALAAACDVAICGGDVTRADELFVVITVVGYVDTEEQLARRDGARAGDLVGVTGALGGSGAGLLLIERKHHGGDLEAGKLLLQRHLRPRPQLNAGRALVGAGVHAMIDVSDGIASDLVRICERSSVRAEVRLADLPLDDGVAEVASAHGLDPLELAATAGEDYELLFTAPASARDEIELAADSAGFQVSWIGRILAGTGDAEDALTGPVRLLDAEGRSRRLRGWDHLTPADTA